MKKYPKEIQDLMYYKRSNVIRFNGSLLQKLWGRFMYPKSSEFMDARYIYQKYEPDRHLSDLISDDWKYKWVPSVPVFITTQTGTGKNYFINEVLIRKILQFNRKSENKAKQSNDNQPSYTIANFSRDRNGEQIYSEETLYNPAIIRPEIKKVLVLSNRVALNLQMKQELARIISEEIGRYSEAQNALNFFDKLNDQGKKEHHDFGAVQIYSYHQLTESNIFEKNAPHFDFVICDECHFFVQDASINEETCSLLYNIVESFQRAIRIYMSATMEDVANRILEAELFFRKQKPIEVDFPFGVALGELDRADTLDSHFFPSDKVRAVEERKVKFIFQGHDIVPFWNHTAVIYDMERNYDYLQIRTLAYSSREKEIQRKYGNLIEEIRKTYQTKKWVIFIRTTDDGMALEHHLNKSLQNDETQNDKKIAAFISSESKNEHHHGHKTYMNIITKETFDEQILITTSVLDNGVNIKDKKVKNIVIYSLEKISFLQMLGRVRRFPDSKLVLYLPDYDANFLETELRYSMKNLLDRLDDDKLTPEERLKKEKKMLSEDGYGIQSSSLYYSQFSKDKLISYIGTLKNMIRALDSSYKITFQGSANRLYGRVCLDYKDLPEKEKQVKKINRDILRILRFDVYPMVDRRLTIPSTCDDLDYEELSQYVHGMLLECDERNQDEIDFMNYIYLQRYMDASLRLGEIRDSLAKSTDDTISTDISALKNEQIKYRELFNAVNQRNDPQHPNQSWKERCLWIESQADITDSSDETESAVSSEKEQNVLIQKLKECAIKHEIWEKLNQKAYDVNEHDSILKEKGWKSDDKENSPYWKVLQSLCKKLRGKEIKQYKVLSDFMKEISDDNSSSVCYSIQTAKIRGTEDKGAIYWIIVEEKNN